MRRIGFILHILLIIGMLASGIPFFNPGDVNHDGAVGLEDAIMGVKDFARSAENPAVFTDAIEKAISSLSVVAGLETSIVPARDSNVRGTIHLFQACFSVPSQIGAIMPADSVLAPLWLDETHYQSIALPPAAPPPNMLVS